MSGLKDGNIVVIAIQVFLFKIDAVKYGNLVKLNAQWKVMAILSFAIGIGESRGCPHSFYRLRRDEIYWSQLPR